MEVLYKKQGKFFSASREYYVRKIHRLWEQSPFCFHDLRRSRKLLEIYLLEEQRNTVDAAIYAAEREVSAGEELLDAAEVMQNLREKHL